MVKKISLFLSVLLIFALLVTPVSAEETINDLKKIYNNLQTHLYTPYYKDSLKYEAYSQTMDEIKALLASDAITQAEISKYYNGLRVVYSDLMRDTYDYSSLETLIASYNSLDPSIFTSESWKKLLSVRDSVQKELSSPTLFVRDKNYTAAQYADYIQGHIATFTNEYYSAFNSLELLEKPAPMTKEYLLGYYSYVSFCTREELLGETEGWSALQEAFNEADALIELENTDSKNLDAIYNKITSCYVSCCNEAYPFSAANEILVEFKETSPENYSAASWKRYSEEINFLKEDIVRIPFFFIPLNADKKTCDEYSLKYQNSFMKNVNEIKATLVPIATYNQLSSLCEANKDATAMEGLEIKLNSLKKTVKEGEAVLSNDYASLSDYENAIKKINTAKQDLELAEKFLLKEKSKVAKQDPATSRLIIIIVAVVFILSLAFAIVLSRHYFGRVNFRK